MASPRSRLVTWSYTHLSFHGRRFWRPHPDLDRAATPALPPGGGRPLCGADSGCSLTFGQLARAPVALARGAEPPEPPRLVVRPGRSLRWCAQYRRAPFLTGRASTKRLPIPTAKPTMGTFVTRVLFAR